MTRIRLRAIAIGALLLLGLGMPAAGAATAPGAQPAAVAGTYTVHVLWNGRGNWFQYSMTLNADHTGSIPDGDSITWSKHGRKFSMNLEGDPTVAYKGMKSKAGFNTPDHLGTVTNSSGGSGVWYAVKTG